MNRIHRAIEFAAIKHREQVRKGTNIPYIVHPMEVMQILTAEGCAEDLIIAGLLHDTVEDTDTEIEEIEEQFGAHVAALVAAESEDKSKTWEERKQHTLDYLSTCGEEEAICCFADKLSNMTSIAEDYERIGEKVWERFRRGKEQEAWYYRGIAEATKRFSDRELWKRYSALVNKVFAEI